MKNPLLKAMSNICLDLSFKLYHYLQLVDLEHKDIIDYQMVKNTIKDFIILLHHLAM